MGTGEAVGAMERAGGRTDSGWVEWVEKRCGDKGDANGKARGCDLEGGEGCLSSNLEEG